MNTIDEIKDMLDKLNEEIEDLRAENEELKHRLSKYESVARNENINMTIKEMGLSVRSYHCLTRAGIKIVADLLEWDRKRFYRIRDFGKKSATEVCEKMEELGFDDWSSKMR